MNANISKVEDEDISASVLEYAANDDIEGFKKYVDREPSSIDEVGRWYGREKGTHQMVVHHRTPLMVAATYGSIDVLKLILSFPEVDVNRTCGLDKSTALHCAASSGSLNAVDIVKLILAAGADPSLTDANGRLALDVIVIPPKFQSIGFSLQTLLSMEASLQEEHNLTVSIDTSNSSSPSLELTPSPNSGNFDGLPVSYASEKKEYPVDPSLPDIKNSIYSSDEFRMFSFKVRPCSRAYSHDWTECPFVHPGENARRRDPRKYHYSCVPCPDFRKGACRRGDMCEYAHGVFESWLHPAQYRTRLCKDGTNCNRRVCFFAHTQEELRPLYVSTCSSVPSPRSSASAANAMDFAAAMNMLPGSPSSISLMSPTPFAPPMSPSINGISNAGWTPQQNVPSLHLPGSNLQASRLRSSLNARDIPWQDPSLFPDTDSYRHHHFADELSHLSQNLLNRSGHPNILTPSNLEDIFAAESLSPRYSEQAVLAPALLLPSHKSALLNQFQQQQPNMLSPIKTKFPSRNVDRSLLQSPFGVQSPGRMSPHSVEPFSPMSARVSILARHENHQQHQFRSLSSRDLGSNAAAVVASLDEAMWGTPNGSVDCAGTDDEFNMFERSSFFELVNNGEEPDLSWVHTLVKESPQEMKEKPSQHIAGNAASGSLSGEGSNLNPQIEKLDQSILGAWLEQMQLDQLMAQ